MAAVLVPFRRVLASALPDPNWPATQVAPDEGIRIPVTGARKIHVQFLAFDAGDLISSGTLDLQLVRIATSQPPASLPIPSRTIVGGGATDTGVTLGDIVEYDVTGVNLVTVRVVAKALAGTASYVEFYWEAVE